MKTFFAIALAAVVGMASAVPTGTCKAHKEACEVDTECCGGSCQRVGLTKMCFDDGQCQFAGAGEGDICAYGTQCCNNGGCAYNWDGQGYCRGVNVRVGGPCSADDDCWSNNCTTDGICGPSNSPLSLAEGEYCISDLYCQSGFCDPEADYTCAKSRLSHPYDPVDFSL